MSDSFNSRKPTGIIQGNEEPDCNKKNLIHVNGIAEALFGVNM
jgi:hypothetical protein